MRLNVGIIGAEQLLRAIDRQLLGHIDVFTTTVVALARIALGVLVGQHRALGFHDPRAGIVFGCDQFDVIFLARYFVHHGLRQYGIEIGNRH